MTNLFKAAILAAATLAAMPATADNIKLFTPDRSVEVTGDLVGFNGEEYVVLSSVGIVSFAADAVVCEGAACANAQNESFNVASLKSETPTTVVAD